MKNREINLLDCTLRDGGYLNDWEFGHENLVAIFERLADTGVDIVEVGFLDERRPFDINRSIFPNTQSIEKIWGNVKKRPGMVVGMIDYGTCDLDNLQSCEESYLDGIRVIFKKEKMRPALQYCKEVKALGYKVFAQLVSVTAYEDNDLLEVAALVNEAELYAVSIVDTYGVLDPIKLLHYYEILDKHVKKEIKIGFHGHNNLQMAYANSITFLLKETDRDIIVDGTLFGMGKSAGNAPIELIGHFMNTTFESVYDINPMMEAIEESIKGFYAKKTWGYKPFFYLSAANSCHPSYVEYFLGKGSLSQSKLNELLSKIEPEEKKLLYDREVAEQLYQQYIIEQMTEECNKLRDGLGDKNILLIGPGRNINLQEERVKKFILEKCPITIAINYIPENIIVDYVFVTKVNRYCEMTVKLCDWPNIKLIATSNLECRNGKFDAVINREPLLEKKEEISDNSFLMLLRVLQRIGIKKVACAGLDGYSDNEDNYATPNMEYEFVKKEARYLNRHIRDVLYNEFKGMEIDFITYSHYTETEDVSSATF